MIRCHIVVMAVLAVLVFPGATLAHSLLVRSQPERRATVARPPEEVRLWFSEPIEPAYARLSVWDAGGKQVDAGDAAVDPANSTTLAVRTPALRAGRYTVRYRVLSVDGHIVESSFDFTVRPAAAPKDIEK
ncbi:MAG TPA: copper resistance CopC family protein [Methylomirabilota bacterium]|jgi:methionine-rich copper-binding protein CopC|nr:copper resistance CopC family protein [Methylomirabilota bacterium]